MLHKNLFNSSRLGRLVARTPGWLKHIVVVVGALLVSIATAFPVSAQDAPAALMYITLPYNSTTIWEHHTYNLDVIFTSEIIGPLTLEVRNGLPAGATFSTSAGNGSITGNLRWTPSEVQGGQDYVFRFKGTVDMGLAGRTSVERELKVTVGEMNEHPGITPIQPEPVNEDNAANIDETVTFTVSATDGDLPKQKLTFSSSNLPAEATLNATTGAFSWSPTETQGGKEYQFHITVTDDGSPNLFWTEPVRITVNEVNDAPVLNTLTAVRSVYEANSSGKASTTLNFSVSATDNDLPAQNLSYSASGLPVGAKFIGNTFSWSPSESQGGEEYSIEFKVTDNGSPPQSATQIVKIIVLDVNDLPVWEIVPAKTVNEDNAANINETLSFTVSATDHDIPLQNLTYSASFLPLGATFDPATRQFSWSPTETQGGKNTLSNSR